MDAQGTADQVLSSDDWAETADILAQLDNDDLSALIVELNQRRADPDTDGDQIDQEIAFAQACLASGVGPALFDLRLRMRTDEATRLRDRHNDRPPRTPKADLIPELGEHAEFLYYSLFEVDEGPDILAEVLDLCRQALRLAPPREHRWVFLNVGSMASRQRYVLTSNPTDLRRAITLGRRALTDAVAPEELASSRCVLANALFDRWTRSGRRVDVDDAIAHYRHVLDMNDSPEILTNTDEIERNLLAALHDRWRRFGDDTDLADLDHGLDTPTAPDDTASDMTRARLRAARDSPSSIAAVVRARALLADTSPNDPLFPVAAQHLGALSVEAYQITGELDTIVEAIDSHRAALAKTSTDSADRSTREANFVAASLELLEKQTDPELLAETYDHAASALARTGDRSPDRPIMLGLFANAAMTRFEHYGHVADLLDAEHASILAHRLTKPAAPTYPGMADRVCTVLRMTADLLVDDTRLASAIRHGRIARDTSSPTDPRRPVYVGNLGLALADAADKPFPTPALKRAAEPGGRHQALQLLEESVNSTDTNNPDHVTFLSNLASTWAEQWYDDRTAHAANEANRYYADALNLIDDDPNNPVERLRVLANRAALSYAVANHTDNETKRDQAAAAFSEVLAHPASAVAETSLVAAGAWGASAATAQRWDEALTAYERATDLGLRLAGRQASERDRLQRLRQLTGLGTNGAIAALKADQPDTALRLIRDNRQVLQRLAAPEHSPQPHTNNGTHTVHVDECITYLLAGNSHGMILTHDHGEFTTIDTPELTSDEVSRQARPYFAAFNNRHDNPQQWRHEIDTMCQWLADTAMATITQHHAAAPTIDLVTSGMLSLLPLHAAANSHHPTDGVLDTHSIRYRTTNTPKPDRSPPGDPHLVAIAGPTPDLDWSRDELDWTTRPYHHVTRLDPPEAIDQVADAITRADIIHISAHGDLDTGDPFNTGLALGEAGLLTANHIRELDLNAQLVFLSACDTGLAWYRAPDELLGIPTAFIQAGAQTVISAAWSIPEFATALLVGKFHETLRTTSATAEAALRTAQLWVRDATNREKAEWMGIDQPVATPDRRQHTHPYYWAGFSVLT